MSKCKPLESDWLAQALDSEAWSCQSVISTASPWLQQVVDEARVILKQDSNQQNTEYREVFNWLGSPVSQVVTRPLQCQLITGTLFEK